MSGVSDISGYRFKTDEHSCSHAYLLPAVDTVLTQHFGHRGSNDTKKIFDLGCGNGSVAAHLVSLGYAVVGVDPSEEGIEHAKTSHPDIQLELGSAYDDLAGAYGTFSAVVSLEVVEHVYSPRKFAATLYSLVEPGGIAIVSTPYHGYWKNLALAVTGKFDRHFTALWDHGHIKFWSISTLGQLLCEAGFTEIEYLRVGRIPCLAKSMIAIAQRPQSRNC